MVLIIPNISDESRPNYNQERGTASRGDPIAIAAKGIKDYPAITYKNPCPYKHGYGIMDSSWKV